MCGKNVGLLGSVTVGSGSPPRVREKLPDLINIEGSGRITPACAGKTVPSDQRSCSPWDHPRVCGKNKFQRSDMSFRLGSPPRVREKRSYYASVSIHFGITPACAGKTSTPASDFKAPGDHPRVCGKN